MKKSLFIIVASTFMIVLHALGQDGVYCHEGFLNDKSCCLYLEIRDGRYLLDLSYELSLDLSTGTTLSIGKCHEERGKVVLTDELFGYNMVFERIDTLTLIMRKGFISMRDASFNYLREPTSSPFVYNSDTPDFNRDPYCVKTDNCRAKHERKVAFQVGSYALGYENEYLLNIGKNGRFEYYYRGVKLSEGRWKRRGNLLSFIDDGLNKPFFAIIKENGIVSSFLPGAFFDTMWSRVE